MPISTPTARGPACASCTDEYANTANPALIINTLAPTANNAGAIAVNFFVPPDIDDNIFVIPTVSPVTTPTKPAKKAIAPGPAFDTATADRANK